MTDETENKRIIGPIQFIIIWGVLFLGWITHIFYCLINEEYMLMISGAILPTIGAIHGVGIWIGAW